MNSRIKSLMEKAKSATPIKRAGKYTQFIPIVDVLMKERGFNCFQTVKWLAEEGEIPKKSFKNAYYVIYKHLKDRDSK